jgi:hypothetical protein
VGDIGGDRLNVATNGMRMIYGKPEELPASVVAEFEIRLLDEVLDDIGGGYPPAAQSAQDGKADRTLITKHESLPGRGMVGFGARPDKLRRIHLLV